MYIKRQVPVTVDGLKTAEWDPWAVKKIRFTK